MQSRVLQQNLIFLMNGGMAGNSKFISQNAAVPMVNTNIAGNNCK